MVKNKNKNIGFKAYLKELLGVVKDLPMTLGTVAVLLTVVYLSNELLSMVGISRSAVSNEWGWVTWALLVGLIIKSVWKPLLKVLQPKRADWMYYLGLFLFLGGLACYVFMWILPVSLSTENYSTLSILAGAGIMLGGLVFVLRPVPKTKK